MLGGMHSEMKTCFENNVILFIMEWIVDGSNLDDLRRILVHFLQFNGGIPTNNIVNKLVSLAQMELDYFEKNFKWNFNAVV
jgi:hypothetical protein